VYVLTSFPNRYNSYRIDDVLKHEISENIEIHRIEVPSHKSGMIDQVKSFYNYFRNAYAISKHLNFDLVFATSSRLFTAFLGSIIARKSQKPLYLDIRDIFIDTMHSLSKPIYLSLRPILILIERITFKNAAKVNLVSDGFMTYFNHRFPHIKYTSFTNGIDSEFIQNNFVKLDSNSKTIKVLYAGNIGQGQALHKIIPDLLKSLPSNYFFEIIGDGGVKHLLLEKLNNSGLKNYSIMNPVPRKELIYKYKNADILFLHLNDVPAFKKVLPSKLFEYGATGKPIMAGVTGFCKEFILQNIKNVVVFEPCNHESAQTAIKKLNLKHTNRSVFINKFDRQLIMDDFAKDIISLTYQ
jgi:glycosyltransferase involved in cell wall biosynthesis